MTWEGWLISISVFIIALAFAALVVYLIITLLTLRNMVNDIDQKVHSFDPLFRVVSKAGGAIERKASHVQQLSEEVEDSISKESEYKRDKAINTAMEVAEWALIGLALFQKIKEKRWR